MTFLLRPCLLAAVLILPIFPASLSAADPLKIGSVDMSKIFDDYWKTKEAKLKLDDTRQGHDKVVREGGVELERKQEDLKKLKEEVDSPALTEDKRAEKRKALEVKFNEFNLAVRDWTAMKDSRARDFLMKQEKMKKDLVDEITVVIQQKAKKEGYTMIVDKTGLTSTGITSPFIFIQDSLDITPDIIKILNVNAPAPTTTSTSDKSKEGGDKAKDKKTTP